MKFLIEISGYGTMLLAIVHIVFPKAFNWKNELASLSLINRQLMTVHTFFIAFGVFLMGLLCATSAELLLTTKLGSRVLVILAIFWLARLLTQIFWYSTELWKGKKIKTMIHVIFLIQWTSLTIVYSVGAIKAWFS